MAVCLKEETLQAYFDGELAPEAAAAVLRHLNWCATCAAFALEVEQAASLINSAFDDELPENIPTASLRARLEALAATPAPTMTPAFAGLSFARHLLNSLAARLRAGELSPLHLGLAVAVVIVAVILAGGLATKFWGSATSEPRKNVVQRAEAPVPARTPSDRHNVQEQRPEPAGGDKHNQPRRVHRVDHIAHRTGPEPTRLEPVKQIEPATAISAVRHTKPFGNTTLWNLEATDHLRQTQLLLRSFRNTSIDEGEAASGLAYEKRLSRELLSKNRLLRRSAENKEDSQAEELLGDIEPLLLDIANLPDKPSQDEVRSIKELIREQKIIAAVQIYSAKEVRSTAFRRKRPVVSPKSFNPKPSA